MCLVSGKHNSALSELVAFNRIIQHVCISAIIANNFTSSLSSSSSSFLISFNYVSATNRQANVRYPLVDSLLPVFPRLYLFSYCTLVAVAVLFSRIRGRLNATFLHLIFIGTKIYIIVWRKPPITCILLLRFTSSLLCSIFVSNCL